MVETAECNLVEVWLMEGGVVDRSSTKWLSVWISEVVYTWTCEHIVNMTSRQDISNQQDNICSMWLIVGLSNDERNKCDTLGRPSDDHEDTCATVLTTSCVSAIDVYRENIAQTQPSTSPEWGGKHDIEINMSKTIVGKTSEKEARHVNETHEKTFFLAHACY